MRETLRGFHSPEIILKGTVPLFIPNKLIQSQQNKIYHLTQECLKLNENAAERFFLITANKHELTRGSPTKIQ